MFKKSSKSGQLNIFTSPKSLFSGNSLKMYEDEQAWHNQFRKQVTMRIDEDIFSPLYCLNNGTPNAPIRLLVAMMILKEAEGLSDHKIFENCRFNLLVRSALGLHNADDPLPTESTYYLFRKRIQEYAKEENEQRRKTKTSSKLLLHKSPKTNVPNSKLVESVSVWTANCWAAISPGLAVTN